MQEYIGILIIATALLLMTLAWQDRGHWYSTGATKTIQTPMKNGYNRSQKFYEQIDLDREGRARWRPYSGYTIIAPDGTTEYIDTTDYGM